MHPEDKDEVRRRALRAGAKEPSYEEKKRSRERTRAKNAERERSRPRRQAWSEEDDTIEREAIRRPQRRQAPGPGAPDARSNGETSGDVATEGTVIGVARSTVRVRTSAGEIVAERGGELEVVGDEVSVETRTGTLARVASVRPRRTVLARPDPGGARGELVLAANIDVVGIVGSVAEPPLRPGLIDRVAIAVERGGATPIVCLNKVDLLEDRGEVAAVLAEWAERGLEVVSVSAASGEGLDRLRARLDGARAAFVGHSGVGKSSLVNALARSEIQGVGEVRRRDGRGRHTTTSAALVELWPGTQVVDTPGIRQFGLAMDERELRAAFADLEACSARCRFRDCRHLSEPDCAVRAAVAAGTLATRRYELYVRLLASLRAEARPRRE